MNHETLFFGAAMAAALALAAPTTHAQVGLTGPHARAQAAANEGPEALYRFVNRTRMIYGLNIQDYPVNYPDTATAEIVSDANFAPEQDGGAASAPEQGEEPSAARRKELDADRARLWRDMQFE